MSLTGQQIEQLAEAIDASWNLTRLSEFLSDHLDVELSRHVTLPARLRDQAAEIVNHLDSRWPSRGRELLEKLQKHAGNAQLQALATTLLTPGYFSPTGDAVDAIVLDRAAFVNRSELRDVVRFRFMTSAGTGSRVLLVRGEQPCGKSYSWRYLRHLAVDRGVTAIHLRLSTIEPIPARFIDQVFRELVLDRKDLPTMLDEPQASHIGPLIASFKGQLPSLQRRYLLVIDDVNQGTSAPILDAVYALAAVVEDQRPERLWVALLGYNLPVTDELMRFAEQEDALFPTVEHLAEHFGQLAAAGPKAIAPARALEIASVLLQDFPTLTKQAMSELTPKIEKIGANLREGKQP